MEPTSFTFMAVVCSVLAIIAVASVAAYCVASRTDKKHHTKL